MDLALEHSAAAASLAPRNPIIITQRAASLVEAGQEEAALELIRPMLAGGATPQPVARVYADIARKTRQEASAAELLLSILASYPKAGRDAAQLRFQAAELLERSRRYDEAIEQARLGHDARRRPYDPARNTRLFTGLIEYFSPAVVRRLPCATHGSGRPIFIVGMPRSGTSLVEQILASHPAVHGAGELPTLNEIACGFNNAPWAGGEHFPKCLERLSIEQANQLAGRYLARLDDASASARFVTDKLPANFRDLWLVQILFPQAHVIHCIRDARDTCLSCYMTYFDAVNDFAQDLGSVGRYCRDCRRLAAHWRQALDLPILDMPYESLVADLEGHTRRLLDFLGLEWDDRCLRFYENPRYVATASRPQVRKPIYSSSVGRWRHYEKHLAELLRELSAD